MAANLKNRIQTALGKAGYQLRRIEKGVSIDDPYQMQRTLSLIHI